ncbi:MAG: divalent metal cation transporter, partial [Saprospiraceae bacterium]|nr:divalent metal cation transporter [Saprospiraceae bacterium]
AYAAKGLFGWEDEKSFKFRAVWISVLVIGIGFSLVGFKSITIIKFAQIANALLLPLIALFLLSICNDPKIMDQHINSKTKNILSFIVILITVSISLKTVFLLFT